jgi:SAM-dependent methyltransferase
MDTLYDLIGRGYARSRRPDPRIAVAIRAALGGCKSLVNVGAGTGSYEPSDMDVVAVEPSQTMIRQRPAQAAPVVRARAEALPFRDATFDAALALLTLHHWSDQSRGLAECARCARERVVLYTIDVEAQREFWLLKDYFPGILAIDEGIFPSIHEIARVLGPVEQIPVPVPSDCIDGFLGAYWRRPEAYLDPAVRSGMSSFSKIDQVEARILELKRDIESGEWDRRNGALRRTDTCDVGYRLIIARNL